MKTKGFFVCIEGLDGCGKTTQAKVLVEQLKKNNCAIYTAEPTSGAIGQLIQNHYLHGDKRGSGIVETLLFAADRFEHVTNEILPALKEGKLIVCDRYLYSSLAYQGAAGIEFHWIRTVNEQAIRPDLAIFLDVEPDTTIHRLKRDRSVMENLETQTEVRNIYLQFVEKGELVRIDGNQSKERVADEVLDLVLRAR